MKPTPGKTEALDGFIDEVLGGVTTATGQTAAVDVETKRIAHLLCSLREATPIRPAFINELGERLHEQVLAPSVSSGRSRTSKHRPNLLAWLPTWARSWSIRATAAALIALVVGFGAATSPVVGEQIHQIACFVPNLGIRNCGTPGLVATQPVSVSHGGKILTVQAVLSGGGETIVRFEMSGFADQSSVAAHDAAMNAVRQVHVTLQDDQGRKLTLLDQLGDSLIGIPRIPGSAQYFFDERFGPLDSSVRSVLISVDGPPSIGRWTIRVPVSTVSQTGLSLAKGGGDSLSLHGVTVRITDVAANQQHTVVELAVDAKSAGTFVRSVGGPGNSHQLVLRDDKGQTYSEMPSAGRFWPERSGTYTDDVVFPPLAPDVRSAQVIVPSVTIEKVVGATTFTVPLTGAVEDKPIAIDREVTLGPYSFRVVDARVENRDFFQRLGNWLSFDLSVGSLKGGELLIGPGRTVSVNGRAVPLEWKSDAQGQWTTIEVPLPETPASNVSITLQNAQVAVQGPWRLRLTLR
ncbi:MAG: hypothetical protein ACRDIY_14480 [Chloroflexota bacterium]